MDENINEIPMQQNVPGRQLTLCHMIVEPNTQVMEKLGIGDTPYLSIGIISITPGESAIIAADTATKYSMVRLENLDRYNGSVLISGDVESIMNSLHEVKSVMCDCMGYAGGEITMT